MSSIVVKNWDGATAEFGGLYADKADLPKKTDEKYKHMATGSNAMLVANDGLHYLEYERTSDKWYE